MVLTRVHVASAVPSASHPTNRLKSHYAVICCYFNYGVSIYTVSHHAKGQIIGLPPITRKHTLHEKSRQLIYLSLGNRPTNESKGPNVSPHVRDIARLRDQGPDCHGAASWGETPVSSNETALHDATGCLIGSYICKKHYNLPI